MKLLTKAIENSIPKLYATDGESEKKVHAKFFTPWADWTWYAVEGERTEDGDFCFFGMVKNSFGTEWGYFTLSELESISGLGGLKIERDRHYTGILEI